MNVLEDLKSLFGLNNSNQNYLTPKSQAYSELTPEDKQKLDQGASLGKYPYPYVRSTPKPVEQYQQPNIQPIQQQYQQPSQQSGDLQVNPNLADTIKSGLRGQLGKQTPIEDYINLFVDAAKKYPIFNKYPYLLPQIAILESSGGTNVTRNNNPLNWGARLQASGQYNPSSWEQSIMDAITAIAGDYSTRQEGTPRATTADYYAPFRQSGNLNDFVSNYEPSNPDYLNNLQAGIDYFQNLGR